MKHAALVLVLAACSTSSSSDFPPRPGGGGSGVIVGGGGGGGGTVGDAGIGDGGGLTGRVCLIKDLRSPISSCDARKAGGLTVTLGTATATTAADGSFAIAAPLDPGLPFTWHVTGTNLVTSVMLGTETTIPAILRDDYTASLADVGLTAVDEGHGSILVRAVSGFAPAPGVTATLSPLADSSTFYDGGSPQSPVWNTTSTQSAGAVWVPYVPLPGPVTLTLTRTDGTIVQTRRVIEPQAITFVTQDVQ